MNRDKTPCESCPDFEPKKSYCSRLKHSLRSGYAMRCHSKTCAKELNELQRTADKTVDVLRGKGVRIRLEDLIVKKRCLLCGKPMPTKYVCMFCGYDNAEWSKKYL